MLAVAELLGRARYSSLLLTIAHYWVGACDIIIAMNTYRQFTDAQRLWSWIHVLIKICQQSCCVYFQCLYMQCLLFILDQHYIRTSTTLIWISTINCSLIYLNCKLQHSCCVVYSMIRYFNVSGDSSSSTRSQYTHVHKYIIFYTYIYLIYIIVCF